VISPLRSWQVGEVLVTRIEEASFRRPIEQFIPGATADVRARYAGVLSGEQLDSDGMMTLVIGGYVVESRGRRILVDTCLGSENAHGVQDSPFLARLEASGYPAHTIDAVVCTHVHLDHVGWNTTLERGVRRPTFSQAEYVFCAEELDALRDEEPEGDLYSSVASDVNWVVRSGRARLVAPTHALTDEVSLIPTFGHSPGHVSVAIESADRSAVITGDAVHHPIQLLEPDLVTEADSDGTAAVKARRSLIDRVVDERAIMFGTHFVGSSALRLEIDGANVTMREVPPRGLPI
jgi:glyoxylase-like metal-dependent hydrolase (beta-lactamase superfamily II)